MRMKRIAGILTALGMLSAMGTSVWAEEAASGSPAGYATVCIEKFTIGQGYLMDPVRVPFYDGETGSDLIERVYGAEHINGGKGVGSYISSLDDADNAKPIIPEFIASAAKAANMEIDDLRETDGALSSYDFCAMSGWMYLINNESVSLSLGEYLPDDGDVIRFVFTVYGYGSDMGLDTSYMSEWGGTEPLCPVTNRDIITESIAAYPKLVGTGVYKRVVTKAADLNSDQDILDKAVQEIEFIGKNDLSMGDVNKNNEVDVFDAIAVAQSTVGKRILTDNETILADMNGDFAIDVFDAIAIAKLTVSK